MDSTYFKALCSLWAVVGGLLSLENWGRLDRSGPLAARPFLPEAITYVDIMSNHNSGDHSIPRIIHQTYRSHSLPDGLQNMVNTWRDVNPGWDVKLYNDTECLNLVRSNFPEYLDAYLALPKNVERADFFRYMVVLLHGGVYADCDTECKRPMDSAISSNDKMVTGWELEFSTAEEAANRSYARTRQILQWVFAAVPGHPVLREACDLIAMNANKICSRNADRDTLERTGPGMFTDIVLKHAFDPEEGVRILPRITFGVNPAGDDGLTGESPGIAVHHHYVGSWKEMFQAPCNTSELEPVVGNNQNLNCSIETASVSVCPIRSISKSIEYNSMRRRDSRIKFYPVGIPWEPSFVVMVQLKGHGAYICDSDVSADLTTWGNWHAGMHPSTTPHMVDVLISLLDHEKHQGLVDVGAGLGFFTLAAASRGHPVVAFESDIKSVEALRESVQYNGFGSFVNVVNGAVLEADACKEQRKNNVFYVLNSIMISARQMLGASGASMHARAVTADEIFYEKYLKGVQIGGLRISASAAAQTHEIISAALGSQLRVNLKFVIMEFMPFVVKRCAHKDPSEVLQILYKNGFVGVYHAGDLCKHVLSEPHRWNMPFHQRAPETDVNSHLWCRIEPHSFVSLVNTAVPGRPVNLVFVKQWPQLVLKSEATRFSQVGG